MPTILGTEERQPEDLAAAQALWDELEKGDNNDGEEAIAGARAPASEETREPAEPGAVEEGAAATAAAPTPPAPTKPAEKPSLEADRVAGLEEQNRRLQEQLRNLSGRVGGINSELERVRTAARGAGFETPSQQQIQKALQDDEAMANLVSEYPEFGGAMSKVMKKFGEGVSGAIEEAIKQRMPDPSQFVSREEFEKTLREQVTEFGAPGWKDKIKTPEFHGWFVRQPDEIKKLSSSNSPADAVRLIHAFDEYVNSEQQTTTRETRTTSDRQRRIASAAAIPSGGRSAPARSKPDSEKTPAEIWAELDEQETARR